eukprot:TRINITY_DN67225_c12_g8_i1.p1 TRINITY_DN67225_c12_g8~~TRINITY_DN67225_c12_g8_i1.p1  ORF type:complete len:162 (-),score=14.17 TRINITY_DN67225_c12_g8_i1:439-924(-)
MDPLQMGYEGPGPVEYATHQPIAGTPASRPRGYYRGPLPLPGRKPVTLKAYRKAAERNTKVKHRDQARDKYILARNRRAQMAAQTMMPQEPVPEALPPPNVYETGAAPGTIYGQFGQYPAIQPEIPADVYTGVAPSIATGGYMGAPASTVYGGLPGYGYGW